MDRRSFLKHTLKVFTGLSAAGYFRANPTHADKTSKSKISSGPDRQSPAPVDSSILKNAATGSSQPHAAIIGAGVSGLAAAGSLARRGWKVEVFEKESGFGGFCSTRHIDGFNFDLGPHVFGRRILNLVHLKPGDVDPTIFSESFLIRNRVLDFPYDLLYEGYILDVISTIVKNTLGREKIDETDMKQLAEIHYGEQINREIFQPLIEKWSQTPMTKLDARYFTSRMHSKLDMDMVRFHLKNLISKLQENLLVLDVESKPLLSNTLSKQHNSHAGITPAPGYAGQNGACIIPERLAGSAGSITIHSDCPVTAIGVEKGNIVWLKAGEYQISPDFVISTIALNKMAGIVSGDHILSELKEISYLNILFVFVRIARPLLVRTKWTWIPRSGTPFYRMSEMKALNGRHAPKDATGMCLEVVFLENDPEFDTPNHVWEKSAHAILDKTFSIKKKEIIGCTIERRKYAYPNFNKDNTAIISRYLKTPYGPGQMTHDFDLGIDNLALAGRAGTFVYLLTPEAIMSGNLASNRALEYFGDSPKMTMALP